MSPRLGRDWAAREPLRPEATTSACQEAERLLGAGDATPPDPETLDAVFRRVGSAWRKDRSLSNVTKPDLRLVPWVLFYPPQEREEWLGAKGGIAAAYIEWLNQRARPSTGVALIHVLLEQYLITLNTYGDWAKAAREMVARADARRLEMWKERHRDYSILASDKSGPEKVLQIILASREPVEDVLEAVGLNGTLARGGFVESMLRIWFDLFADDLERVRSTQNVQRFLTLAASPEEEGLRFPDLRVELAEALLLPFADGPPPPDSLRDVLQNFLLMNIGDPRLERGKWHGISAAARRVLQQWLNREALEDFFLIFDKTSERDESYGHHWPYRKAYWRAWLQQGSIDNAWVILGPRGQRMAEELGVHSEFGVLESGGGVDKNHSVLLMEIHGVTVAEWSHNGSVRFYLPGNAQAPPLYRQYYSPWELRDGCDFKKAHQGSENGTWQFVVSEYFEMHRGITVPRQSYMNVEDT